MACLSSESNICMHSYLFLHTRLATGSLVFCFNCVGILVCRRVGPLLEDLLTADEEEQCDFCEALSKELTDWRRSLEVSRRSTALVH